MICSFLSEICENLSTLKLILALLLFSLPLRAQDAELAALRTTVFSLRPDPNSHREMRGANAQLTVAKHQLRDWIESLLLRFPESGDEAMLSDQIHAGIRDAKLFCVDFNLECYPSSRGFLDEVQVSRESGFLIVRTAVGIWCGYDYSAYLYRWAGNRWQRIWQNEQNTYTEKDYRPQMLHAVHISEPDAGGNRLLLTLGSQPGCASAFQPAYWRVWPMNARYEVQGAILDGTEVVNVASEPPIEGLLAANAVMIEFTAGGTAYGESHKAIRHFEIRNGQARQVDPIAPTPRDFVEQWLSAPWRQSAARAETPSLQQWHAKLHREDGMGDFPDPALRCTSGTDLWQIGTHLHEGPKNYYLVRWKQPWHFTMMGVSDRPYPDCTIPDPTGDEHPELRLN
jgi:hypothetical protein